MKCKFRKSKPSGLVRQFSLLLLLSAVAGVALYFALYSCGHALSEHYIEATSFIENRANSRIEHFQSYISKNDVCALDSETISAWGKENSVVLMEIYRGNYLLYSTAAPEYYYNYENTAEATLYDWATYHSVDFTDGQALVVIYADDMSVWNFGIIIISAAVSIAFSLIIFLLGCKKIVKQIIVLNTRIQQMEAGDLDVDIPVWGDHELSQLARSLHSMRCAFKEQMERESAIFLNHQTMITEMSHDLRTPLTTLQIYTDILRYKKYDPSMLEHHLELIDTKARQIKQLADNIFEYSLISKQQKTELEAPAPAYQVFYDLLSEYIYQWSRQGFLFDSDMEWSNLYISVYSPYIKRIMDNIFSNISKYASREVPVFIKTVTEQDNFCITLLNKVACEVIDEESNHIGLSNIETMMQKMNGICQVQKAKDSFSITLRFPSCN